MDNAKKTVNIRNCTGNENCVRINLNSNDLGKNESLRYVWDNEYPRDVGIINLLVMCGIMNIPVMWG